MHVTPHNHVCTGLQGPNYAGLSVGELANAIGTTRDKVANSTAEIPLWDAAGMLRVAAADVNGLSFARTASQVGC